MRQSKYLTALACGFESYSAHKSETSFSRDRPAFLYAGLKQYYYTAFRRGFKKSSFSREKKLVSQKIAGDRFRLFNRLRAPLLCYNVSMATKQFYLVFVIVFLLGIVAGMAALYFMTMQKNYPPSVGGPGGGIACTMDAMMCPDGSYVGRSGPNCQFVCPGAGGDIGGGATEPGYNTGDYDGTVLSPTQDGTGSGASSGCKTNADCVSGYECVDVSPVVREGIVNMQCHLIGSPLPICLSGEAKISVPGGNVLVKEMKEGAAIWTVDQSGKKIAGTVLAFGKTAAPAGHKVVHLTLSTGYELFVSPGHKIADGRAVGELRVGDELQSAKVVAAELIPYAEKYTYDILPSGETGMYFANGILLQSTLKK